MLLGAFAAVSVVVSIQSVITAVRQRFGKRLVLTNSDGRAALE